jgi:hypothetical protein
MSSLQAEDDLLLAQEEVCLEYFAEIIEIQKFREMLNIGAEELIRRYEHGLLEKKDLDTTLAIWYITESELREKVTKIYDVANVAKCFDNIGTKEKR